MKIGCLEPESARSRPGLAGALEATFQVDRLVMQPELKLYIAEPSIQTPIHEICQAMSDMESALTLKIRDAIATLAGLPSEGRKLDDDTDLYRAGMKSFASVQLMVALEDTFEFEFPESMLTRATFRSPAAIGHAVGALKMPGA